MGGVVVGAPVWILLQYLTGCTQMSANRERCWPCRCCKSGHAVLYATIHTNLQAYLEHHFLCSFLLSVPRAAKRWGASVREQQRSGSPAGRLSSQQTRGPAYPGVEFPPGKSPHRPPRTARQSAPPRAQEEAERRVSRDSSVQSIRLNLSQRDRSS